VLRRVHTDTDHLRRPGTGTLHLKLSHFSPVIISMICAYLQGGSGGFLLRRGYQKHDTKFVDQSFLESLVLVLQVELR
jgi:hypothetical protein